MNKEVDIMFEYMTGLMTSSSKIANFQILSIDHWSMNKGYDAVQAHNA